MATISTQRMLETVSVILKFEILEFGISVIAVVQLSSRGSAKCSEYSGSRL